MSIAISKEGRASSGGKARIGRADSAPWQIPGVGQGGIGALAGFTIAVAGPSIMDLLRVMI